MFYSTTENVSMKATLMIYMSKKVVANKWLN